MPSTPNYHSFLLRLWRDAPGQPWRASLHCTATGEKLAFADVSTLFAYLSGQTPTIAIEQRADNIPLQEIINS